MSTAEFPANLNRRRQAALCATLVCVGLILLLGGKVRDAVGITLLGMAFSWALGSNNRLVHWLYVICGLLLLVIPVGDGFLWPREKSEEIKGQTSLVETEKDIVQDDVSSSDQVKRQLEDAFHGIDKDNAENHLKRIEILKPEVERLQIKEDKDNTELYKGQAELQHLEAEGIFRHVMKNDWGNVAGGLLLLSAGLGLMVGVKPVRKDQPETPR